MARYSVKISLTLEYEVEADNEQEAEQKGYDWENYLGHYDGLDSIEVEALDDEDEDEDED
jgi:hypothetical protein